MPFLRRMRKWFYFCGTPTCGIPPGPPMGGICSMGAPTCDIKCSRRKWWDLRSASICFIPIPMEPFAEKPPAEPPGAFAQIEAFPLMPP